jgi:hypothetical protein
VAAYVYANTTRLSSRNYTTSRDVSAQDASRVANGQQPEIRKVRSGSTLQPYWDAGAAFLPYGDNYYSAAILQVDYQHTIDGLSGGL